MTDATTVNIAATAPGQGQIAAALAVFQSNIPQIVKDSEVDAGRMKYKFAPLEKLVPIILPLLAAQEIAFTAVPDWTELGFGLRAALIHSSGEKIEGFYPLGSPTNPAQAIGSAISYARRYALLSLTGVAPAGEDDDGATATAQTDAVTAKATDTPVKETAASVRTEMGDTIENSGGLLAASDAQKIMVKLTNGKDITEWTLTDMKKGRTELNKLLTERQKEQK